MLFISCITVKRQKHTKCILINFLKYLFSNVVLSDLIDTWNIYNLFYCCHFKINSILKNHEKWIFHINSQQNISVVAKHPDVKWKFQSCDSFFIERQTSGGLERTSQLPKYFISYLHVYFSRASLKFGTFSVRCRMGEYWILRKNLYFPEEQLKIFLFLWKSFGMIRGIS